MGSALTQSINSLPTRLVHGDKAAEKFMEERMYKPEQPLAYEYAGDVGNFLEKLETEYKIPPMLPEAVALQYLTGPATSQAMRTAGRGAEQVGRKLESAMEPVVRGALEQGGLPREMVLGMGANTQSNVVKPKGGNWLNRSVEDELKPLLAKGMINNREIPYGPEFDVAIRQRIEDLKQAASQPDYKGGAGRVAEHLERELENPRTNEAALNKWIQSNLTNYVKKEMATPEDPVRRLAEEGIVSFPVAEDPRYWNRFGESARNQYDGTQMAQSDLAKQWENRSDTMIGKDTAQQHQDMMHLAPGMYEQADEYIKKLPPETTLYKTSGAGGRFNPRDLGFDHVLDVLRQDVAEGRIRPEQLNKVSMEQAVRRTYEYDQEMAKRMRETALKQQEGFPIHKEYPEGYKWIELAPQPKDALRKKHEEYVRRDFPDIEKYDPYGFEEYVKDSMNSSRVIDQQQLADALRYEGNTMGHCVGGYCPDVVEGKTRIFSLRDAKGEPHVTVEVRPKRGQSKYQTDWFSQQPEEIQNKITEQALAEHALMAGNRTPQEDRFTWGQALSNAIKNNMGEVPDEIIQIKGKGNAKPKADYLPYVQDFVKGGKWSDVGDLQNTGLQRVVEGETPPGFAEWMRLRSLGNEPKVPAGYYTPQELVKFGEESGLKEKFPTVYGGWRKNLGLEPDVPMDPPLPPNEMKRGGVAISNNPDTMMLELGNKKMKNGVPAYGGAGAVIKQGLKAAKPEVMKASEALGKIEGRPLKITQADRTKVGGGYLGGPGFSGLQLTEPEYRAAEAAWAVQNAGTAKTILGGGGDNAVYAAMLGTPTQHQSNQMVFDKLLGDFKKAAKRGELTPELRDLINMRLAAAVDNKGNPVFPANVDIMDKKFRDIADTFSRRSVAGHLMGGVQVGGKKGQIIDYDKIIRSTTDPDLLDQPTGALGNRLFTLSGGIVQRPDLHPAFPTILQGEDLGVMFTPVERDIVMKDFVEKTMREKGRKPGYMDYTRGNPPTQLITEDILTELQKLGKKKGGAVHKAEGGEISGDDLILEERPL
jgi:hypothetical protein